MSQYGMPYMGNKSTIAEKIIELLPSGKRFVDLFGGGGAMSHCASQSGKYESVFYNEINPIVVETIKKAISGFYNYNRFKPEFITREMFFDLKDKDGYIAYIWSFGNNGSGYLFSKDIEEYKKAYHNMSVFLEDNTGYMADFAEKYVLNKYGIKQKCKLEIPKGRTPKERRLNVRKQLTIFEKQCKLTQIRALQQLQQLERLEQLERLQRLQQLELNCGSYLDYIHKEGDVVYCDPPYEGTEKYCKDGFNHKEFYDWVATREYPVYFSSYAISDDRFFNVYEQSKRVTLSATTNSNRKVEVLYCNKNDRLTLF